MTHENDNKDDKFMTVKLLPFTTTGPPFKCLLVDRSAVFCKYCLSVTVTDFVWDCCDL